jgi:hypothetical protein
MTVPAIQTSVLPGDPLGPVGLGVQPLARSTNRPSARTPKTRRPINAPRVTTQRTLPISGERTEKASPQSRAGGSEDPQILKGQRFLPAFDPAHPGDPYSGDPVRLVHDRAIPHRELRPRSTSNRPDHPLRPRMRPARPQICHPFCHALSHQPAPYSPFARHAFRHARQPQRRQRALRQGADPPTSGRPQPITHNPERKHRHSLATRQPGNLHTASTVKPRADGRPTQGHFLRGRFLKPGRACLPYSTRFWLRPGLLPSPESSCPLLGNPTIPATTLRSDETPRATIALERSLRPEIGWPFFQESILPFCRPCPTRATRTRRRPSRLDPRLARYRGRNFLRRRICEPTPAAGNRPGITRLKGFFSRSTLPSQLAPPAGNSALSLPAWVGPHPSRSVSICRPVFEPAGTAP